MASTCTNPVILSMICPPVDQSGQESDWSTELEEEEEEEEGEGSLEWLGENEGALLSDWSTDWEDSDGDDDEEISCEADDLWESFFVSDDPYNPLNFSARAGPPPQRTPNMADTETPAKGEKIPSVEGETTAREKTERNTLCHSLSSSSDSNKETDFSAGPNRIPGSGLGSVLRSSHEGLWEEGLEEKEGSDWDFPSGRLEEDCPAEIREAFAATEQQDSDGKKPKSIKKVRFSPNVELHRMITWSFAYRAARKGPWEECGRDRCRFQRRIAETETIIGRCFEQKHRDAVWAELYAE
ncbi:protein phosphatase 1 regulatory subunit 15B-like [Callorhinchus milii]|nr:protein phosphatase 1 regulatory subunit 15B-like [Callorhinchus milii]